MPMKGLDRHLARLRSLSGGAMEEAISKALFVAAADVKAHAQHLITQGSVSGAGHVASSPGQPPQNDTGVLAAHIEVVRISPLVMEVRSSASGSDTSAVDKDGRTFGKGREPNGNGNIAAALEFGTSKMAARPYMAPARDARRGRVKELVQQAVDHVVKSSG